MQKAKGPASRFQWGYQYLDGLLRLTPDDTRDHREGGRRRSSASSTARIAFTAARLSRLNKLDEKLREWNTTPARAAVLANCAPACAQACEKSQGDVASETGCKSFGSTVVATT